MLLLSHRMDIIEVYLIEIEFLELNECGMTYFGT